MISDDPNELGLFWHWGPATALTVTLTVTLTTWSWWPPEETFINSAYFALYVLLNLLSLYNYIMSVMVGPGLLPRKWHPEYFRERKFLQYCNKCEGYKAPRSHHCRRCDRCVLKMDHHCPWINRCVGWANQAYFVYFLIFYMMTNMLSSIVISCSGYRFFKVSSRLARMYYRGSIPKLLRAHIMSISMGFVCFGISVGVVLCMLKLLYFQIPGILTNTTDIERWIIQKAKARHLRQKLKDFVYPYNVGWYANLGQVFNIESQRGGGIEFPVVKGCDQFTLTREQLAQKVEKRSRTLTFKCIRPATGSWVPLLSQGLIVTLNMPCTDDPRIKLRPNDLIRVTRIRTHWLFGERVVGNVHREGPIRGWFPARCAINMTGSGDSRASDDATTEDTKLRNKAVRASRNVKSGKLNQD